MDFYHQLWGTWVTWGVSPSRSVLGGRDHPLRSLPLVSSGPWRSFWTDRLSPIERVRHVQRVANRRKWWHPAPSGDLVRIHFP